MSYYLATVRVLVQAHHDDVATEAISEALRNLCLDDGSSGFVAWEYATQPAEVDSAQVEAYAPDLYDVPLDTL